MYDADAHKRAAARELGGNFFEVVRLLDLEVSSISCAFDALPIIGGCVWAYCVGRKMDPANVPTPCWFSFSAIKAERNGGEKASGSSFKLLEGSNPEQLKPSSIEALGVVRKRLAQATGVGVRLYLALRHLLPGKDNCI